MIPNHALNQRDHIKFNILNYLRSIFSKISERASKRFEAAQNRFYEIIELEKRRILKNNTHSISKPNTNKRSPDGWLIVESECKVVPLYSGGNTLDNLEIRLVANLLHVANKSYSSNDCIEAGGKRYIVKLLPSIYRSEGES